MDNVNIEILKKLINSPSENGTEGEKNTAKVIYNIFKENGFQPILQKVEDRYNVILKIQGKSSEPVIWNGHLDTVPVGKIENWDTDPYTATIIGDIMYGRGTTDMKGGLSAQIASIILNKNIKPQNTIYFVATCDEEKNGIGASKFLEEYDKILKKAKLLLIGEPTDLKLGIAQKGCMWIELRVKGKTSHGANPKAGVNAITESYKLYSLINNYVEKYSHQLLGNSTVALTSISGGVANNVIPDFCKIVLDIRYTPNIKDIVKEIEALIKESNIEVEQIKILNHRKPIELKATDKVLNKIENALGKKEKIGITYFTDASIWCENYTNLPVVLLGAGYIDYAHKPNECISLSVYNSSIELYNIIYNTYF